MSPAPLAIVLLSGFISPAFLAGVSAAALPILIHLIHRKMAPDQPFPAIELLLRTQRQLMIHLRWKHWLLMMLRALLLALVAVALARPYFTTQHLIATGASDQPPTAYVFVVDDTPSMRMKVRGRTTAFDRVRELARDALKDVRSFDQVALLSVTGTATWEVAYLTQGPDTLRPRLGETAAGFRHATVWPAVARATGLLAKSPLTVRKIVVFSDMARTSWLEAGREPSAPVPEDRLADLARANIAVQIVDCHPSARRESNGPNRAVTRVEAQEQKSLISVAVACRGFGLSGAEEVACTIDGTGIPTAEREVKLGTDGAGSLTLGLVPTARTTWITGRAALAPDALPADDTRWFALRRERAIRVLIVDGDPQETLELTESFYIAKALNPGKGAPAGIAGSVVTINQLAQIPLKQYDCIILANVPLLNAGVQQRIADAVASGCGLFVALGSRTVPNWPRGPLSALMPAVPVGIERIAGQEPPLGLAAPRGDPITDVLSARWRLTLSSVAVRACWRTTPAEGSRALLDYSNGLPAWIESSPERAGGHVLMSNLPLDRDWSNFCIHPTFVPLLRQAVRYLGETLGGAQAPSVLVGETLTFRLPAEVRSTQFTVVRPDGGKVAVVPTQNAGPEHVLNCTATELPGAYTLRDAGDKLLSAGVVNVDTTESDTRIVGAREVMKGLRATGGEEASAAASEAMEGRRSLAGPLLWVCVVLLLFESWYARK